MNTRPLPRRPLSVLVNAACISSLHLLCQTSPLHALDQPVPQVEVESRMVEVSSDFAKELDFKWNVSGGLTLQTTTFSHSYKPSPSDFARFPKAGGSKELYRRNDEFQKYLNGDVFFLDDFARSQGFASFSGGKVRDKDDVQINGTTLALESVRFHSARISGAGGVSTQDDDVLAALPYIQLNYNFKQCPQGSVGAFGQYSFGQMDESSGWMDGQLGGQKYSFKYPVFNANRVIFDPTTFNNLGADPDIRDPRRTVRDIRTRANADLDVGQHRLTFGVQAAQPVLPWLDLKVAVGPTVTIFDYDYRAKSELWIGNRLAATHEVTDSDTKVRFGLMSEIGARIKWGAQNNWFVDTGIRFDYTDQLKVGNGSASAEIGNWYLGGNIGMGYQF